MVVMERKFHIYVKYNEDVMMILVMIIPMQQLVQVRTWSSTFLLVAATTLVTSHSEAPKLSPTFHITITIFTSLYHDSWFKTKCEIIFNTSKVTALAAWITSLATYWLIFYRWEIQSSIGGKINQKGKNLSMTVASVRRSSGGSLHIVEVTLIYSNAKQNYLWKVRLEYPHLNPPKFDAPAQLARLVSLVHLRGAQPHVCALHQQPAIIWHSFTVKPKFICPCSALLAPTGALYVTMTCYMYIFFCIFVFHMASFTDWSIEEYYN